MKRRMLTTLAAPLIVAGLLNGCASQPKSYVVLLDNADGGSGKVLVSGSKGQQVIDRPNTGANLDGATAPAPVDPSRLQRDFAAVLAAQPPLPVQFMLYFQSGGSTLTAESQALLPTILEQSKSRPAADVSIIGHTDTVGKAEVNEALALKRAEAIASLLKDSGLKPHALVVESHGERNLLIATPDETDEPRNRRVEVSVR